MWLRGDLMWWQREFVEFQRWGFHGLAGTGGLMLPCSSGEFLLISGCEPQKRGIPEPVTLLRRGSYGYPIQIGVKKLQVPLWGLLLPDVLLSLSPLESCQY